MYKELKGEVDRIGGRWVGFKLWQPKWFVHFIQWCSIDYFILGQVPGNAGQVLKKLLQESGVNFQNHKDNDSIRFRRRKRR